MAGYNEIRGLRVKYLSADPANAENGQVWYNSTSGTLRVLGIGIAAYASSTNLPSARATNAQGGAAVTAGFSVGGTSMNNTEEYNGVGWAAGGNYPASRSYLGGSGPFTAAIAMGGNTYTNATNTYNGTAWTSITNMPTGSEACRSAGPSTAALVVEGGIGPGPYPANTYEWNGSSWTGGGSIPSSGNYGAGVAGTQTAAYSAGGNSPLKSATNNYDGSSWTTTGSLPKSIYNTHGNTIGTQTSGVITGGNGPPGSFGAETFHYDGSVWAANVNSIQAYTNTGATWGTQGSHVFAGGATPPATSLVQEYNTTEGTVTAAAWASGANYPTVMNQLGGSGTQTAGLGFGGNTSGGNPNGSNITAEYNGSSWTSGGNLATAKNTGSRSGVGTQTATIAINFRNDGTNTPATPVPPSNNNYMAMTNVEEYNGSSWTAGTATPDGEVEAGTCGTVSAALRFGGNPGSPPAGPATNGTLYWNDSSWTALNNMSSARYGLAPAFQGTYNAALAFGGQTPAPANVTSTEEFDGTNWTSGGSLNTAVMRGCGNGTQTAALSYGGSPSITNTEGYDGTAWSTRPSLANGRQFGGGAGSSTAGLYIAGDEGVHVEEFTGETVAAGSGSNLTTS